MPPKRRPNAPSQSKDSTSTSTAYLNPNTPRSPTAQYLDDADADADEAQVMHAPYLPTPTEALFLAIYPTTLLLGSLFSHLSPSLRPPANLSTYSPVHQSFQPSDLAPSYWATKRNVLNVYFVKLGWFWCSLALLLFTLLASRGRPAIDIGLREQHQAAAAPKRLADMDATAARSERDARLRRQWQVGLRYALATATWAAATQWFFGASLIDRVFRLSGGACTLAEAELQRIHDPSALEKLAGAATYAACRALKGRWAGGLDISGHVFLLVLGSGMLALETLPVILPWVRGLAGERVVQSGAEAVRLAHVSTAGGAVEGWHAPAADAGTEARARRAAEDASRRHAGLRLKSWGVTAVLGFVALSWWMLLMTAAFFHTWVEKSVACALAGAALWAIYFAPRASVGARELIGMPGV